MRGFLVGSVLVAALLLVGYQSVAQDCYTIDTSMPEWLGGGFIRGDATSPSTQGYGDRAIMMADAIYILKVLYVPGTPPPHCYDALDVNDNGDWAMADAIYLLKYLYVPGEPPPPPPFPDCGNDPTADGLDCINHPCGDPGEIEEYTGDTAITYLHPDFENTGRRHYQRPIDCECGCEMEVNPVFGDLTLSIGYTFTSDPFPLEVTLTYNSGSFLDAQYGFGWQMNYDLFYITNSWNENVIVVREDDRTDIFVKRGKGSFDPTYGVQDSLIQLPVGHLLITKHGTKCYFDSPDHHYVTRIEDANHNELILTRNEEKQLTSITDPYGRQLIFEHQNGKLTGVTGPGGKGVLSLGYDGYGDLRWFCNPVGDTTYCEYYTSETGCHDLKSMTDVRGNTHAVTWTTDFQVDSITTCCGTKTFSYHSRGTTIETDENGHSTVYTHDDKNRIIEIEDALGNIITRTWDDDYDYNMTSETDANGNTTYWDHDFSGNMLTEVNALGDTTWYTWNPDFNKLTSRTDCNHHTTTYEYDSSGNLILEINALGDSTRYWYDSRGLMDSTMNARGFVTRYEYNDCGNRIRTIDALACTANYFYDAMGNDTLVIDANGNPTRYMYDELNRLIWTIDALNCTTSYFYDAGGNDTMEVDANGNIKRYEYDELNRLITKIDALGGETDYAYDPVGNRISETDCKDDSTRYEYDEVNRLIKTIGALSCTTSFAYDSVGNKIAETDGNGHTTAYEYDELNRLTRTIDSLTCTTTYIYDPVGNRISVTDGNGKVTSYRYDELDRLWRTVRKMETEADSAVTEYEYDEVGNRTAVIDANENRTEYEYNERDELIIETTPKSESILYDYDCVGNRIEETRPNGNVITCGYNEKNQLINISDSIGQIASYTYDCIGNRLTEIDANLHTITYEYDALSRLVSVTDPMGDTTTYAYDCLGNLDTLVDRNGNPTVYTYNAVNRRISTTDTLGNVTGYEYDCVGNLIQITDANGHTTAYEYDALNRLIREIYADSTTKEFTYDCVGNLITRKDQNGNITCYKYNDLYYLTKRDYPDDNDDTLSYDKGGRLLTAENAHSFVAFDYDSANRGVETTQNGYIITYGYDVVANTRIITYHGGKVITETRDRRDRLVNVEETGVGIIAHYVYDDADRLLSKSCLNGTVTNYHYNANDWVDSLTHTKDATLIVGFAYDFDKEGNRKYTENLLPFNLAEQHTHSEKYDYDAIYRLINFKTGQLVGGDITSPIKTRTWTLDPVGNWDQFTIDGVAYQNTPNQMNEYDDPSTNGPPPVPDDDGIPDDFKDPLPSPPYDGFNSAHDRNGNLLDDDVNTYEHNSKNRLIRVNRKSDGDTLGEYRYDALSRRIQKDTEGVTIVYLYDGARVIEERIGGSVEAEYIYGNWIDEVLTMDRGGQTYYYHANSLGSIIALTDVLGNVAERYAYDAYGKVSIMDATGTPLLNSVASNSYLFTGRRLDEETGLYYYRARYYSSGRGRFLQRDPLGYVNDINLYYYVGNNPATYTDLLGLWRKSVTTYQKWTEGKDWKKREGPIYVVVARIAENPECCTEVELWYVFKWRHYEKWQRIEYYLYGDKIVIAGGALATLGGAMIVVGLADDITIVGIVDEPVTVGGGTAAAAGGAVIGAFGFIVQGVDWLIEGSPPDPEEIFLGHFWEWKDLQWFYKESGEPFECMGTETCEIKGRKMNPLPGQRFPARLVRSGTAKGKGPSIAK